MRKLKNGAEFPSRYVMNFQVNRPTDIRMLQAVSQQMEQPSNPEMFRRLIQHYIADRDQGIKL